MIGKEQGVNGCDDGSYFGGVPSVTTAAHELKAPLALMRQLALGLQAEHTSEAEKRRIIDQITLTSERALRLTTDLTKASRLEGSLFELEPLNPVAICEDVAHELAPLYKAHGREIRVSSRTRPLLAVANRDLLRRIILNFGDNALHYSETDMPVELRALTYAHGTKVRIGVRDFGPAIPTNLWQRLEARLGGGPQTLHARPGSSGLGLYISHQFAGAMNSKIGAIRHRDGVTFYVDLEASTQLGLL